MTSSHSFGRNKIKFVQVSQDDLVCITIKIILHWIILTKTLKSKSGNLYDTCVFFLYDVVCFLFLWSLFKTFVCFELTESLTRLFFIINLFFIRLTAVQYFAWSWHLGSDVLRYLLPSWRLFIPFLLFHF